MFISRGKFKDYDSLKIPLDAFLIQQKLIAVNISRF